MAWRGAGGSVPQTVAHGAQFADYRVQFRRLGRELLPVDARSTVWREHERDLIKRKPGSAPQCYQCQPLQYVRVEQTAQAPPADRGDQAFFLIKPQR